MLENKDEEQGNLIPNKDPENKSTDAYGGLARGLTFEELSQTGTQKLILNDLSKAEGKIKELEPYRNDYYTVFTEKRVLEEKLSKTNRAEILYSFCITAGGIIIGLSQLFIEKSTPLAIIMIGIGILLVLGGILFKTSFNKWN